MRLRYLAASCHQIFWSVSDMAESAVYYAMQCGQCPADSSLNLTAYGSLSNGASSRCLSPVGSRDSIDVT